MRTITRLAFVLVLASAWVVSGGAQVRSGKFGVGVSGAYYLFESDYNKMKPSYGGGAELSYHVLDNLSIRASFGYGLLNAQDPPTSVPGLPQEISTSLVYGNIGLAGDILPNSTVNPFIFVGANGIYFDPRTKDGNPLTGAGDSRTKGGAVVGIGLDIFPSEFVSITIGGEGYLPITDNLDGVKVGSVKDMYQRIYVGVKYYFFDQSFITKMLKALEERYK